MSLVPTGDVSVWLPVSSPHLTDVPIGTVIARPGPLSTSGDRGAHGQVARAALYRGNDRLATSASSCINLSNSPPTPLDIFYETNKVFACKIK